MTVAITTLRTTIATAITNTGVWNTFSYPPATLIPNSVVVCPGDPYFTFNNDSYINISPLVTFKIIMAVPALDNQGNLAGIEDMISGVVTKLIAATNLSLNISSVSAPAIASVASGDLITAELTLQILTSWS
jgi:hypothetical protein